MTTNESNDPAPAEAEAGGSSSQPKDRMKSAAAARALLTSVRGTMDRRRKDIRTHEGQMACNPPWSPQKLAQHGKSHLSNFTSLEFRALIRESIRAYYFVETRAKIPAQWRMDAGQPFERDRWEAAFADHYACMLRSWRGYQSRTMLYIRNRVLHGHGPLYWQDPLSWQDKPLASWHLMVPETAGADPDSWPFFVVTDTMPVQKLIRILDAGRGEDGKKFKIEGWKPEEITKAIRHHGKGTSVNMAHLANGLTSVNNGTITLADLEEQISGEGAYLNGMDDVPVALFYVRNLHNDKWSMKLFTRNGSEGFLFERNDVADRASDVLLTNPYDIEWFHHDVKGLGKLISLSAMTRDRLFNKACDLVIRNSALALTSVGGQASEDALRRIRFDYDTLYLPHELKATQTHITTQPEGILALNDRIGQMNHVITRSTQSSAPDRETSKTLGQVQAEMGEQLQFHEQDLDFALQQCKFVHAARMRKILSVIDHFGASDIIGFSEETTALLDGQHEGFSLLRDMLIACRDSGVSMDAITSIDPDSCVCEFAPTLQQLLLTREVAQ